MRALIPCGGLGTRMRAIAGTLPKELLVARGAPLIEHVARECANAGVTEILVIGAPEKPALAEWVAKRSGVDGLPKMSYDIQPKPAGLADAIRVGRAFTRGEAFGVALPDNLFDAEVAPLAQLRRVHDRERCSVVAIIEVRADDAHLRGPTPAYSGRVDGNVFRITKIPEKGAKHHTFETGGSSSAYTGVGRYLFDPDVFGVIDEVAKSLPAGAELDDVPVMRAMLADGRLTGALLDAHFHDVGFPIGFQALGNS